MNVNNNIDYEETNENENYENEGYKEYEEREYLENLKKILRDVYNVYAKMINDGKKIPNDQSEIYSKLKNMFDRSNTKDGGKKTIYKLNGEKVSLLHNNKNIQRCIYVKGKTKYCKINNEFILLSKLKKQ